jgi:hypothetical protein
MPVCDKNFEFSKECLGVLRQICGINAFDQNLLAGFAMPSPIHSGRSTFSHDRAPVIVVVAEINGEIGYTKHSMKGLKRF